MTDFAEKNPIEALEAQIQSNPEKVTAETVNDAYNKEKKRIESSNFSPDRKATLLKHLEEDQKLLLEELKVLKESKDVARSRALARSRQMRMMMLLESTPDSPRHQSFESARKWALMSSDPESGASSIKDYEGTGIDDTYGKTRFLFSGYLAALRRYDEAQKSNHTELMYGLATKAYEDSFMDKSLDTSDLMVKMSSFSMKPYLDLLQKNGIELDESDVELAPQKLSAEMTGFFVGYLKLTDLHFSDAGQAEKYRQYLYAEIKSILQSGMTAYDFRLDPSFQKKAGTVWDESDSDAVKRSKIEKGKFQMRLFERIKSPDEWHGEVVEKEKKTPELQTRHKNFVADALSASKALDFVYKDEQVKQVLALKNSDVNASHEALIAGAETAAAKEAASQMPAFVQKSSARLTDVGSKVQAMKEKYAGSTQFDAKEFTDMQTRLAAAQKQLEGLGATETTPLREYAKHVSVVNVVNMEADSISARLVDIEKGIGATVVPPPGPASGKETPVSSSDKYKDGWSKATEVNGRFKSDKLVVSPNLSEAKYRDNEGNPVGTLKGGTEVQLVDVNAKAKQIDDTVFVQVKLGDKQIWLDQSQLEMAVNPVIPGDGKESSPESKEFTQFLMAQNIKEYQEPGTGNIVYGLGEMTDKPLNPDYPGVKSSGNYDVDRTLMQKYVGKKITQSLADRLNTLLQQGVAASGMVFLRKPSLDELKRSYTAKFIPTWEYIAKYEKIPPKGTDLSGKFDKASDADDNPADLAFLGKVYPGYVEPLREMLQHGNDPDGARFSLHFNNSELPVRLLHNGREFEFRFDGGVLKYPSVNEACRALNNGSIHQYLTEYVLGHESSYKHYLEQTGDIDELYPKEGQLHSYYLEFDWNNPDPDIDIEVLPHGRVLYKISRDNVGIHGEGERRGAAEDFDSFVRQMIHLKKWAEGSKHTDVENADTQKEILWQAISSYHSFRSPEMEKKIGRVVQSTIEFNEVVRLYLDWGGGNDLKNPENMMVNMWVAQNGTLAYIVNGHGSAETGSAKNMADLVNKLQSYREHPVGGTAGGSAEAKKADSKDTDISKLTI